MSTSAAFPPPLEIVFSFDTTGSMYGWLDEVREQLQDLIQRLQADIPGIRVAVVAHGDYCDAPSTYVTKILDLTTDVAALCDFVRNVERTTGGDAPECYELVLREVRTKLSWSTGSRRALILIGDNLPHDVNYPENTQKIQWEEETRLLAADGVTIYGVQCGTVREAECFYQTISMGTGGKHLRLEEMGSLFDLMMAVCYREGDLTSDLLNDYEKEVRARCGQVGMARDIGAIFASLRDDGAAEALPIGPGSSAPLLKKTSSLTKVKKPTFACGKLATSAPPRAKRAGEKTQRRRRLTGLNGTNNFKHSNLPLLKRENVPESNFALRSLKWSPWLLALANQMDVPPGQADSFVKRRTKPGYRLKTLRCPSTKAVRVPALFEVAVQGPGPRRRRHVVFSAFSARCHGNDRWSSRLLRPVAGQVDRVLGLGFKVYIRFCPLKQTIKTADVKAAVRRYDYAWRARRNIRRGTRRVAKGNLIISE